MLTYDERFVAHRVALRLSYHLISEEEVLYQERAAPVLVSLSLSLPPPLSPSLSLSLSLSLFLTSGTHSFPGTQPCP